MKVYKPTKKQRKELEDLSEKIVGTRIVLDMLIAATTKANKALWAKLDEYFPETKDISNREFSHGKTELHTNEDGK